MKARNNGIIVWTAAVALAIATTGCSLFNSSGKSEKASKGIQGWFESGKNSADKAAENVKTAAGDIAKEGEKATRDLENGVSRLAGENNTGLTGDWAIETVLGKKAVGETPPFIKFVPSEHRIYGNNGCNVINATYTIDASASNISFSDLVSTMMLCADTNITDAEIGQALEAAKRYKVDAGQTDYLLTIFDHNGKAVMTLMHRDFHFLDGTWAVVAIDGEKVDVDGMKLALDVEEKHLHGNTGCNIINGELETDMDTANSISFSKIGMTRMACPDSGWETRMMMALEEAVTAKKLPDDQIEFLGSNGQQVMLLRRTSPIED